MEENDGGRAGAGEGATDNTSPNRLIICLMILSVSPTIKKKQFIDPHFTLFLIKW